MRRDSGGGCHPLVRLSVSVQVEEDGKRERRQRRRSLWLWYFLADLDGEVRFSTRGRKEAVRMALVNLSAVAAPARTLIVLGAGWPGVLLHEAVGHRLKVILTVVGTHLCLAVRSASGCLRALHRSG